MGANELKWDAAGLITVVVQDRHTGEVRMVAHADREALDATLRTGDGWFYSRSRKSLWRKGETSGNVLRVHDVFADCDADAVIYLVDPSGPSCHTGAETCFYRRLRADPGGPSSEPLASLAIEAAEPAAPTFLRLERTLESRKATPGEKSYTRSLLDGGASKIGGKLREEAAELADAIADESDERVVSEAGDVIYHLLVGLLFRELRVRDVAGLLAARFGVSGHDEKASRR